MYVVYVVEKKMILGLGGPGLAARGCGAKHFLEKEIDCCYGAERNTQSHLMSSMKSNVLYRAPLLALILVLLEVRLAVAHLTIGKYPKSIRSFHAGEGTGPLL